MHLAYCSPNTVLLTLHNKLIIAENCVWAAISKVMQSQPSVDFHLIDHRSAEGVMLYWESSLSVTICCSNHASYNNAVLVSLSALPG